MASNNLVLAKRNFFIGNYNESLSFAKKVEKNDSNYLEAQIILYRVLICKGHLRAVIRDLNSSTTAELFCLRILAEFLNKTMDLDNCIENINNISLKDCKFAELIKVCLAIIYIEAEDSYHKSLEVLHGSKDMECISLYIYVLLLMNRVDLAIRHLEEMRKIDEENILTQITMVFTYLRDGDKLKESHKIIKELMQSLAPTALLYAYDSIYYMNRGKWIKSENMIQKALQIEPLDSNLIFNFCTTSKYMNSSDSEIKSNYDSACNQYPMHMLLNSREKKNREFDELCKKFSIKDTS